MTSFGESKGIADAFLQDATHAPQPIQAAASIALSESPPATGKAFPSGALPVLTVIKPPACVIRSKAERSTTKSRTTGKALARNGSMVMVSPSPEIFSYEADRSLSNPREHVHNQTTW